MKLEALGLLNGAYDFRSETVKDEWARLSCDLSLTFTLEGNKLWGKFDLGIVDGIMHFQQRPGKSSHDRVPFTWRGRENEGPIMYGNGNNGWIQSLGGGRIEGQLDWMNITFSGQRCPWQGTRSHIDVRQMRSEWEGYSAQLYNEENQRRW